MHHNGCVWYRCTGGRAGGRTSPWSGPAGSGRFWRFWCERRLVHLEHHSSRLPLMGTVRPPNEPGVARREGCGCGHVSSWPAPSTGSRADARSLCGIIIRRACHEQGSRPGVRSRPRRHKKSTAQRPDRILTCRLSPASPPATSAMDGDRVLGALPARHHQKKHHAWTGSRADAPYHPGVPTTHACHGAGSRPGVLSLRGVPTTRACHGAGSRPARRTSHRGACGTDAPRCANEGPNIPVELTSEIGAILWILVREQAPRFSTSVLALAANGNRSAS